MKILAGFAAFIAIFVIWVYLATPKEIPQTYTPPITSTTPTTSTYSSSRIKNGTTKTKKSPTGGKDITVEYYNGSWIRKSGNSDWAIENAKKNVDFQNWDANARHRR
jgi:hypothetical protein